MSSNFSKKYLTQTDRQTIQIVEDSRSTNGSLEKQLKKGELLTNVTMYPPTTVSVGLIVLGKTTIM